MDTLVAGAVVSGLHGRAESDNSAQKGRTKITSNMNFVLKSKGSRKRLKSQELHDFWCVSERCL